LRAIGNDQETEIGQIPPLFAPQKSKNGQTKKSRHVHDKVTGKETRESHSVLQAAVKILRAARFDGLIKL
jgi:hypothetical protein